MKAVKTVKIVMIMIMKEINLQLVRVVLLAVHHVVTVTVVTLNIHINTKTIMSVIRRVMNLRIVTMSSKQLKRRLLKRVKTRSKSWSLMIIMTVMMIRKMSSWSLDELIWLIISHQECLIILFLIYQQLNWLLIMLIKIY